MHTQVRFDISFCLGLFHAWVTLCSSCPTGLTLSCVTGFKPVNCKNPITLPPDYLCFQSENRILLSKLINKYPLEIDATVLQKILRGHWKAYLLERPSLELCKSLLMLSDYNISGRLNLMEIPVLLHMLHFWRVCSLLIVLLIAVN